MLCDQICDEPHKVIHEIPLHVLVLNFRQILIFMSLLSRWHRLYLRQIPHGFVDVGADLTELGRPLSVSVERSLILLLNILFFVVPLFRFVIFDALALSCIDHVLPRFLPTNVQKFARVKVDVMNWIVGRIQILNRRSTATTSHFGDDALFVINIGRLGP